jgi:hypothetical protein
VITSRDLLFLPLSRFVFCMLPLPFLCTYRSLLPVSLHSATFCFFLFTNPIFMALSLTATPILHFTTATRLSLSLSTFKDELSQILSTSISTSFHFRINPSCQRHANIFLHFFPHNLLIPYYTYFFDSPCFLSYMWQNIYSQMN